MKLERELGALLRQKRREKGWSAGEGARLYGIALRGKPITEAGYWRIEEGSVPEDKKRRWILACMFGLTPSLLNIPPIEEAAKELPPDLLLSTRKRRQVNIEEYRVRLLSFWQQGYSGTAQEALRDLSRRIYALHDNLPYGNDKQKVPMKQLLCGYLLHFAEIAREQGHDQLALAYFNDAITLAHEEKFSGFEAAARYRRGEYYFDEGNFPKALKDLNVAQKLTAPSQVKGRIINVQGLTLASMALTEKEKTQALKLVDTSETLIGGRTEDELYLLGFTAVRYYLNRAKTLVSSPLKKLREPNRAEEALTEANLLALVDKYHTSDLKRFNLYHTLNSELVLARVNTDQGYYPIATEYALSTLEKMVQLRSTLHVPYLTTIYDDIKESSFGNDTSVAELGLQLMIMQFPRLFRA